MIIHPGMLFINEYKGLYEVRLIIDTNTENGYQYYDVLHVSSDVAENFSMYRDRLNPATLFFSDRTIIHADGTSEFYRSL